jgi:hypothetical protein
MERFLRNLHLTNTMRIRTAVFGAGVSALRVSSAIRAISNAVAGTNVAGANTAASAIRGFLTAVPMVWGTSVSRYVMT